MNANLTKVVEIAKLDPNFVDIVANINEAQKELDFYKKQNEMLWDRVNNETNNTIKRGSNAKTLDDLLDYTATLEKLIRDASEELSKSPDFSFSPTIGKRVLLMDNVIMKRALERLAREKGRKIND